MKIAIGFCFLLIFFLHHGNTVSAQPITFKGILIDKETKAPIPYANIYSRSTGVYTNSDGSFDFKFEGAQAIDTISISCIGYKSIKVLTDSLSSGQSYKIGMYVHTIRLNEIVISDKQQKLTAEQIVTKAIEHASKFYSSNGYTLEAFYKQTNFLANQTSKDVDYLTYLEAALYISFDGNGDGKIVIREIRKSNDNRFQFSSNNQISKKDEIMKEEQRFDLSSNFLTLDYLSRQGVLRKEYKTTHSLLDPAIGNLNNNFVYRHKFKLDTITLYNDEMVYVIKVLPNKNSVGIKSGLLKDYFLPIGRIFISGNDFAILEIQYSYVRNPKKNNKISSGLVKLINQGDYVFKDVVKYKRQDDKLWLSYIMREQADTLFMGGFNLASGGSTATDNQIKNNSYFKVKRELIITRVLATKIIAKVNLISKYTTLYPASYDYNKIFWDELNKIEISSYEREKLDFLGGGKPIEYQFMENGKLRN